MKAHSLLPPTLLVAFSTLLSKFLGVIRDHLLAKTFGATGGEGIYNLDTYYAAFRIPDLLYNLLIFGTLSAAFIPIFIRYKKNRDTKNAWEFANSMLHLLFLGTLVLAVILFILAPLLAHVVAGGFGAADLELTTKLMRLMLLSPIFFSLSAVFISIQDSFKHFFFRSLAPLFYNFGIILGIVYFGTEFGVMGVTWGVIIGSVLQLLIQIPALKQVGFRYTPILGYQRRDVKEAIRLMGPRILGLSINQLTLLVNTLIGSFLMTGSIAIFNLADNLQSLPLGLVGISFAITSFATLSELATEPTPEQFSREIRRVVNQILILIIPATLGMLVLRNEIIDVILVGGRFSSADALLTSRVLAYFLISLFAQSLIPLLSRGFYAYHNTRTPVVTALIGAFISIAGSLLFGLYLNYGIAGVAISVSAGNLLNWFLLHVRMARHLKQNIVDGVNLFKILFSSVLMAAAVLWVKQWIPFEGSLLQKIGWLLIPTVIGLVVYFLLGLLLRIQRAA